MKVSRDIIEEISTGRTRSFWISEYTVSDVSGSSVLMMLSRIEVRDA